MTQPSREGIFAASDLATRCKDNGTRTRTDHNKIRPRSICDGNFLSDLELVVAGDVPLLRNWCPYFDSAFLLMEVRFFFE